MRVLSMTDLWMEIYAVFATAGDILCQKSTSVCFQAPRKCAS